MKIPFYILLISIAFAYQLNYGESKLSPEEVRSSEEVFQSQLRSVTDMVKYLWPNGRVGNQKLEQIIGNGFDFIVSDCESPHIHVDSYDLPLESFKFRKQYEYLMATVKSNYKCDQREKIWRRREDNAIVTFNIKTNKFQIFIEPGTLKELHKKRQCSEYLRLVGYDALRKMRPVECEFV